MRQRGSIGLYLLFSITLAVLAGIGAYRWIHDHKSADAAAEPAPREVPRPTAHEIAPSPTAPPPVEEVEPAPEQKEQKSLADQRAVDPIVDPNSSVSPVFGLPGVDGAIERSAVDRRFKPRARLLQQCWEASGARAGTVRITLAIEPNGHIKQVTLSDGSNSGFETCVVAAMNAVSFSATRDGHPAEVVQPIAFSPAE